MRPPSPKMKRYRGRIRNEMRSVSNHLRMLIQWDIRYRTKPINTYPNQLCSLADIGSVQAAKALMDLFLSQLGPIPSR